jgi:hypothetical protein
MSINYQVVFQQVRELIEAQKAKIEDLAERRTVARMLFDQFVSGGDQLEGKIEKARSVDAGLRCAMPTADRLDIHLPPPTLIEKTILIASDGSQIMPDRHQPVYYGLINTGAIVLKMNTGEAPEVVTESRLLSEEELVSKTGNPISDTMLGLMRDTEERTTMLKLVQKASQGKDQVITLTDGPIELWGRREGDEAMLFEENLKKYLSALSQIQELGSITAGYIDRPGANPVCRMLEIAMAGEDELAAIKQFRPLDGISDRWLFGNPASLVLLPGERSAVFALKSRSEADYQGIFALHFFYINVSKDLNDPQIARIDIPRWVAEDDGNVGQLHACIIEQCGLLGSKPFPYIIHRAHEIAVVTYEEKKQIDALFQIESLSQGHDAGTTSNKQTPKDGVGRTKFKK